MSRPLWSWALGFTSLLLIVLETSRATNAITHGDAFAGVSFIGMALPVWLVSVGGPVAATFAVIGVGLSWQRRRIGHAIVLGYAAGFLGTHVLDQVGYPGPSVAGIAAASGMLGTWITMLWAWAAVVTVVLAGYALTRE